MYFLYNSPYRYRSGIENTFSVKMNEMTDLTLRATLTLLEAHAEYMVDQAFEEMERVISHNREVIQFGHTVLGALGSLEESSPQRLDIERNLMNLATSMVRNSSESSQTAGDRYRYFTNFYVETLTFVHRITLLLQNRSQRRTIIGVLRGLTLRYNATGNQ